MYLHMHRGSPHLRGAAAARGRTASVLAPLTYVPFFVLYPRKSRHPPTTAFV